MKHNATKRGACYALLIVCQLAAAILPFFAVISLSVASELYFWIPGISLNYELYSPWMFALPAVSALCLLAACVRTVRSLSSGKPLGYSPVLAVLFALPIDITLCVSCARGGPFFGVSIMIWPLFAAVLNLCSPFLTGSLNKDDPG